MPEGGFVKASVDKYVYSHDSGFEKNLRCGHPFPLSITL